MYTIGGLSTKTTESPPQTRQGFAEPTLELMYNLMTQYRLLSLAHAPHSSETQRQETAETGSQHRDSAEERSWAWLLLTAQGLS